VAGRTSLRSCCARICCRRPGSRRRRCASSARCCGTGSGCCGCALCCATGSTRYSPTTATSRPGAAGPGPGRAWLAGLQLPAASREVIADCLTMLDALQVPIDRLDAEVQAQARADPRVKVLMSRARGYRGRYFIGRTADLQLYREPPRGVEPRTYALREPAEVPPRASTCDFALNPSSRDINITFSRHKFAPHLMSRRRGVTYRRRSTRRSCHERCPFSLQALGGHFRRSVE
jgi:hypothetical protein